VANSMGLMVTPSRGTVLVLYSTRVLLYSSWLLVHFCCVSMDYCTKEVISARARTITSVVATVVVLE
jgi:hypothetical protein